MDPVRKLMYRCLLRCASQIDQTPLSKVLINRFLPECSQNLDNLIAAFLLDPGRKFYCPSPLIQQSVRDRVREAFRFPLQKEGEEVNYDSLGFEALRYLNCIVRVASELKISKTKDVQQRLISQELPFKPSDINHGDSVELVQSPKTGYILVAHPILDGYFERTVILLTRHNSKDKDICWQGLVLNRPLQLQLKDVEYKQKPEKIVTQGVGQTESGQEVFIPIVAEVVPGEQGDSVMEVIAVQLEQEEESQQGEQQKQVESAQQTGRKRGKKSSQSAARSSLMQHQTQITKHFTEYKKHFGLHLVSDGGPVLMQRSIIHTLHDISQSGQQKIFVGDDDINMVFYGGYDLQASKLMKQGLPAHKQVRFFVGECCWYPNQLENELKEGAWFLVKASDEVLRVLSHDGSENLWERVMMKLGGEYRQMATLPRAIMSLPQWQN